MTEHKNSDLLKATVAAMGQVQKVAKEGRNKHDGYNFASIDDFLALVNPICAANGLVIQMQEAAIEDFTRKGKFGDNAWVRMTWEITVMHTSGQTLPPVNRTVEVLRNGAQAYGSAQSYALKQFLRSFLLIPTGDKDDADLQATDAGVVSQASRQQPKPAPDVAKCVEYLNDADDLEHLKRAWNNLPPEAKNIPAVIAAKDARKTELQPPEQAPDLSSELQDQIPY